MDCKRDETLEFLESNLGKGTSEDLLEAIKFWKSLKKFCDYYDYQKNPPTIGIGVGGNINFSWDFKTVYLECEIYNPCPPNEERVSLFYQYKSVDKNKVDIYEEDFVNIERFSSAVKLASETRPFLDGLFL